MEAYRAFKAGDAAGFDSSAVNALECLDGIQTILSTRPDYSLQKTIDDVMAIPGTNPYVPRMIRKHAVNDMYAPVENYEQLVLFYKPRVAAYLDEMRARLAKGVAEFRYGDAAPALNAIYNRWLDNECRVPEDLRFDGSPIDAVRAVYDCVPHAGIVGASEQDLGTTKHAECAKRERR